MSCNRNRLRVLYLAPSLQVLLIIYNVKLYYIIIRVSGFIFVDDVCNFYQVIPDKGWYTPQRVSDSYIGLESTEVLEDILLSCEKKTEFISLLKTQWQIKNKKDMLIKFGNQWDMRASSIPTITTQVPARRIVFAEMPNNKKSSGEELALKADKTDSETLKILAPVGLSYDVVEERSRRKKERQKVKERKRKQEEAARRERQAQREDEREQQRLQRIQEKKAAKRAADEAKAAEKEAQAERQKKNVPRKFEAADRSSSSNPTSTGGAGGELAKILARRAANN